MEAWKTSISTYDRDRIILRGYRVEDLMHRGNFGDVAFLLLRGRMPSPAESRVWNAVLIASSDHGPTPPSTMAARVIASGNRKAAEAAVAGGLLAIGDAHGGAGEEAMRMLQEGMKLISHQGISVGEAGKQIVQRYRIKGRRIPGVGHRVHERDPRTVTLWAMAREEGIAELPITLMQAIADALSVQLGRTLPVNVDGALAAVLLGLEFPPEVGKLAFILGRCAGIAAHLLEELTREAPMRIHVPFTYDGPHPE
ncbi:MAG: citryl-CoA lyase [Armatimonadota bacterium]|nr:citryl-CoA lyase [Armatimonadota bacterium]